WRTHYWTAADCSNGLPGSGWVGAAQGQNGSGTSGQVQCLVGSGSHYNHPTWAGATSGTVTCEVAPLPPVQTHPAITTCTYLFSDIATGWRTRYWTAADCTNGLPAVGAPSVGNGMNGGGTAGMVDCQPAYGQHFNHSTYDGATNGQVSCTYLNPAAQ